MKRAKVIVEKFWEASTFEAIEMVKIKQFINILEIHDLPKEYIQGVHFFQESRFIAIPTVHLFGNEENYFVRLGDVMSIKMWEKMKHLMKECGERLSQINKTIRERKITVGNKPAWKGSSIWFLKPQEYGEVNAAAPYSNDPFNEDCYQVALNNPIILTNKIINELNQECYQVTGWANIIKPPYPSDKLEKIFNKYQKGNCFYDVGDYIAIPETQIHQRYEIAKGDIYSKDLWVKGIEYMRKCVKRLETIEAEEALQAQEEIFEI